MPFRWEQVLAQEWDRAKREKVGLGLGFDLLYNVDMVGILLFPGMVSSLADQTNASPEMANDQT